MTQLSPNSSPKLHKSGIFGTKFRHFCFLVKFCKQTNLRVLISNTAMVFLKFLPKNTQIRYFWLKIPKYGIFGPKFRHFCFFTKICNYTNSMVLISNMTIVVLEFQPENTQIRHFDPKCRYFHYFTIFCNQTNLRVLISNMVTVFSNSSPKNTQIRDFWSQIYGFLFLHKTLQQDKFKDANLKHDNNIFKFPPKNTQIRHFWSQI